MTAHVHADRITAGGPDQDIFELPEGQIEELRAWARANGIDPNETYSLECAVIDLPLVRAEQYLRNERGERYLRAFRQIAMEARDYPIRVPLPDWWQPRALGVSRDEPGAEAANMDREQGGP